MDKYQLKLHEHFAEAQWLSDPVHIEKFLQANTFYRKNIHRFAIKYLGLTLHLYQQIALYLLGVSKNIDIVAARATAKSFIIAIYACCVAILYPGSMVVLTSGTKGQARRIVVDKIQNELMPKSVNLRREILKITADKHEAFVRFRNGSTIQTVTCADSGLGARSTMNIIEEAKTCKKELLDKIISPFKIVRQIPFMQRPEYIDDKQFQETPKEVAISSNVPEYHWLYGDAMKKVKGMMNGDGSFFIAFDYALTLKHGIRTREQMEAEMVKMDALTWKVEYENLVLRTNTKAYFTYDVLNRRQTITRALYPRKNEDVMNRVKNPLAVHKQIGEIRVLSCDIAAIDRQNNDNSAFSLLRLFPESGSSREQNYYAIQVPYIEAFKGMELRKQAVRIRQLFADFDCDYIVLDTRSAGTGVYDALARVLYDEDRDVEYPPFKAMNDATFANRIKNPEAEERIYVVNASADFNYKMAQNLLTAFMYDGIDILVPRETAAGEIAAFAPEYLTTNDPDTLLYYESPYMQTMLLINEMIKLESEELPNTGKKRLYERPGETKDRYVSVAMGAYFANLLALDTLGTNEEYDFNNAPSCVSRISF